MGADSKIQWTHQQAAAQVVNAEVRCGLRPHPNMLPCSDCGHVWTHGERRHEYHHHQGYDRAHWFDVLPLCTRCHAKHGAKTKQTHCLRGHEFTPANTKRRTNGTRECRACRRAAVKARRGADYWRTRRATRKESARG